jgi:hypothetical protein
MPPKPGGERRAVLEGLVDRFGVRIVVAHVGSGVGAADAEVGEELGDALGGHGGGVGELSDLDIHLGQGNDEEDDKERVVDGRSGRVGTTPVSHVSAVPCSQGPGGVVRRLSNTSLNLNLGHSNRIRIDYLRT